MRPTALAFLAAIPLFVRAASGGAEDCDSSCLIGLADAYMSALPSGDQSDLEWAERVRYTENDVAMMVGDGVWGTATSVSALFRIADPQTGNVLWFGTVEEHGLAAYYGMRLKVSGKEISGDATNANAAVSNAVVSAHAISEVEAVVGREGTPGPFTRPDGYSLPPAFLDTVPVSERHSRSRLISLANGYYDTLQLNDGTLQARFAPGCQWISNGYSMTRSDAGNSADCQSQLELGVFKPIDRVRSRRYPIVDAQFGVVVALATFDRAARYVRYRTLDGRERAIDVEYPNSLTVLELLKIRDGRIERIEGISAFQPYGMPSMWSPAPFE